VFVSLDVASRSLAQDPVHLRHHAAGQLRQGASNGPAGYRQPADATL